MRRLLTALTIAIAVLSLLIVGAVLPTPLRQLAGPPAALLLGASMLPGRIEVCGRDYHTSAARPSTSRADAGARFGEPLVIVDAWSAGCVPGACSRPAAPTPCTVVAFVEVRQDELVAYDLVGGP
jgi:hypothetical protein